MGTLGSAVRITAATVSLVLVGACGAGTGDGPGQSPAPTPTVTGGGTAPSATPSPASLSVAEYSAWLTKAMEPLQSALIRLGRARTYKRLADRVSSVQDAAGRASTALAALTPPAELAEPNTRLATALRAFAGETATAGTEVSQRSLCTGAVVRAELGDADATAALRRAVASVYAKLPGEQPVLKLPSAGQRPDSRPSNGDYIRDGSRGGRAELEIENGGSADALVTLAKGGKPAISVYVRKGRSYTVRNVSDGTYAVYFSGGSRWDGAARGFGRNCAFSRFEDPMRFRTTRDARGIYWQNFRITLQPVIGGTARTNDVDPDDFPDT